LLIDRVRGSRFRAVPEHREDFARADRQLQRSTDRTGLARAASANRQALVVAAQRANTKARGKKLRIAFDGGRMEGPEPLPSHMSRIASVFFSNSLAVLLSAHRYPSGGASLFAAHGEIVLFALFLLSFGQRKNVRRTGVES
jgi:hypothetical protein